MKTYLIIICFIFPCCLINTVLAKDNVTIIKWQRNIRISYASSSGNSESETFAGRFKLSFEGKTNRGYFNTEYYLDRDDDKETENKLDIDGRWEHLIADRTFLFTNTHFKRDKMAGHEYRIYGGPGIGYDIIRTPTSHLKGLVSINYDYEKYTNNTGLTYSSAMGKFSTIYSIHILENLIFKEDIDYTISFENSDRYFFDSESAIQVKINNYLALELSYKIEYQNVTKAKNIEHTDRKLLASLVVNF